MIRGLILTGLLLSTPALAGDVRFNVNFGNWRVGNVRPTRAFVPQYPVQPQWYWVVYAQPPPPSPPAPQIVYVEREANEQPPQIVVVQLPPVEVPVPVAPPVEASPVPAQVVAAPAAPLAPRVPGPDVFLWTDEDGVVNYSTRVPADARKRAKKLSSLVK